MNVKDKYKILDRVAKRMQQYKNDYPELYKSYSDYLTVHGFKTTKGGIVSKSKKNLEKADNMLKSLDTLERVSDVQRDIRKRGEKVTKKSVKKAVFVRNELNNIKEFIYLKSGKREIDGLTGTKGKKTYSELYKILQPYLSEYENYKKGIYEDLEDF